MSEEKPKYITDTLEMMGVTEPKQIIQEVSGFIPVFEAILEKYNDHITALVFGRRWQYCRMRDGVCTASLERIADDLKISAATVMRHTEKLVEDGYLIDLTPDLRNVPHSYADAGLVIMKSQLSATVSQRNTSISQRKATVSESQLIKDSIRQDKQDGDKSPLKTDGLPIEWQIASGASKIVQNDDTQARRWDTAQLIGMGEKSSAVELAYAFMQARDVIIPESKIKGQRKAIREMIEMGVQPEHVTEAVRQLLAKNMTVIDLFSVSKTAQDLANKKEVYTGDKKTHAL